MSNTPINTEKNTNKPEKNKKRAWDGLGWPHTNKKQRHALCEEAIKQ